MKLSHDRILSLQQLLNEICGLNLNEEEAQRAGMAVIRFVSAKQQREREHRQKIEDLMREENGDGQLPGTYRAAS